MKKICISLALLSIIILTIVYKVTATNVENEYLRMHVRANSNTVQDQTVKYEIRDLTVKFLTPYVAECKTKSQAEEMFERIKKPLEKEIDLYLLGKGFTYKSQVDIRNEYFPTRVYEDVTLEEGYYDAVIIQLGEAKGDNWWCVVYPPLCFTKGEGNIQYRSKILDVIRKFYDKG